MKDNQLQQIHKARKAFYKANYEGKRAIIQKEINDNITLQKELDYYFSHGGLK